MDSRRSRALHETRVNTPSYTEFPISTIDQYCTASIQLLLLHRSIYLSINPPSNCVQRRPKWRQKIASVTRTRPPLHPVRIRGKRRTNHRQQTRELAGAREQRSSGNSLIRVELLAADNLTGFSRSFDDEQRSRDQRKKAGRTEGANDANCNLHETYRR